MTTHPDLTKDKDYFFEDYHSGRKSPLQSESHISTKSIVALNTIQIHQFLLKRDSQIFKDLFSLPQPPTSPHNNMEPNVILEGKCEERPLVFQDPTNHFRALCWALYARPNDFREQQTSEKVDLVRIIDLLTIAHKYEIGHLWDWSLTIVKDHLDLIPGRLVSSSGRLWAAVEQLQNLSNLSPDAAFVGQHIEAEWLLMIQSSDLDEAQIAFSAALDAAERSPSLRRFHGKVYYTYMKTIGKPRTSTSIHIGNATTFVTSLTSGLSESRTSRFCRGFWSLSQLRLELSVAPNIDDNPSCEDHADQCKPMWADWWERNVQVQIQDPRDLILDLQSRAESNGIKARHPFRNYFTRPPCGEVILDQLRGMVERFDDTLADHFMGA